MSNLEVLREIQSIYNPKTAFGNKDILNLFKKFVKPNKDGLFEAYADRIVTIRIEWRCVDCGAFHSYEVEDEQQTEAILTCRCGAKSKISF